METVDWIISIGVLLCGYLIGSIPTGYVLGKLLNNIDIRNYGSGNTGFSNVFRLLGKVPAIITLIGDVAVKGCLVALLSRLTIHYTIFKTPITSFLDFYRMGYNTIFSQFIVLFSGILSVIGHNWPIWLKFKGGKGMATTAGIFLCFAPISTLFMVIFWLVIVISTRYTSLGNLIITPSSPLPLFFEAYYLLNLKETFYPLMIAGFIAGLLVLWTHRENIQRLVKGKERKFGDKSERIE